MHTLLIFLTAVLCLSALFSIICYCNDDNMAPVGKVFQSLFVGLVAVVLLIQVVMQHPTQMLASAGESAVAQYSGLVSRQDERPDIVSDPSRPGEVVSGSAYVAAPAQVMSAAPVMAVQPQASDSTKDMLLGGALGYALGSAGRGSSAPVAQSVTSHTTIIHNAPTTPSAPIASAPRPSSAPVAAPSAPKVVASAPRATFRNTFTMTRSRR